MSCDSVSAEMCSAAIGLYSQDSFAFYMLLVRSCMAPIAIIGLILLCISVLQAVALHFNVRCLLTCMLTAMVISNTGVLATALYVLYIVFFVPTEAEKCNLLVYTPSTCLRLRQLWSTGGLALAISALCIAAERILATIKFRTYEKQPLKWIGILLCFAQVVVGLLPVFGEPPHKCMPYCLQDLVFPEASRIAGDMLFSFNFISLAIFFCLWLVNRRRKEHHGSNALSRKFQIKENVNTARLMVPVMIVVALMTFSSIIIYHLYLPIFQSDLPLSSGIISAIVKFGNFHEYQTSLMPVLSLLMLVLLPYFCPSIRKSLYRLLHIKFSNDQLDNLPAERTKEIYFRQLQGQWETVRV